METSPSLARLGSYRLLEKLGTGAMGTVYLAEDEEMSDRVALKVLHPYLLERKGFFKRFQREARAGGQVDHPNVVRTLDCDFQMVEGTPQCFLIMEYVEGRTLRALLQELGQVPEALLRELARQVAAGLDAIHAAGIVHRDLKPENVLVTRDHQVRIMDLGIAKLHEASVAITKEGQFAGSLLYASPEQIRHEQVGPASDLYALGVVMYELATGVSPFRRDNAAAVVHAHLEEVPSKASDLAPELTPFFTEVVSTLLATDPAARFASAAELGTVLETAEKSPWWKDRQRVLRGRGPRVPRIPVRRETKLYGRETDLELLRRSWERAKDGQGNTLLIEGEAGIGKTRLVDAFLRGQDGQTAQVLYGSYPPAGGMGGISDAILARFGSEGLEGALKPYLNATPSLVSPFADVLRRETPPLDAPSLAGDTLHAVLVHLMRALAAEQPLLWIAEDLHFADADSRKILLSLARAVEGHRVMLLLTTRPGLSAEDLAHFARLESFRRAALGRLSAREVILLLQDAFRSEALAEKLGGKIALKSDGVPFFVFEMIRGLREGQFITQLPDGSYVESKAIEEIEVPSAVKDLIEARLRDLSDEERAILDLGAVQGFEFEADLVAGARGMERVSVLERLASIERRSGVARTAGPRYQFDHHQIQEVLYSRLSPGLREEYHSLLARSLAERERVAGQDPADLPGETAHLLAWHLVRSRDPKEVLPHLKPALDHLERSYRSEAAIDLASRALETPGLLEGTTRVEILLKKAGRHELRGERELEHAALDEALALADASQDAALRANVRCSLGGHLVRTSEYAAAGECLDEALGLARKADESKIEASATGKLGQVAWAQGRYQEARAHHEKHLALAREIGDRHEEAIATGNLGRVYTCEDRYEQARAHIEKQLALAREIGDRHEEGKATQNLGVVFFRQGRCEEARARYEAAGALAREIADRSGEAHASGNLGGVFVYEGRYEEARAHIETHLALAREMGDRRHEAIATGNLAALFHYEGAYEESRTYCEKHLALSREIGYREGEIYAAESLGFVFESQGRYEEARAQFESGLALSREIGDRLLETSATIGVGRVLQSQGRSQEARVRYERALTLARGIGARRMEGRALANLASLADAEGDSETALRLHREALIVRRELGEKLGEAASLFAQAGIEAERGDHGSAVAHLDEALALARELNAPVMILAATVQRARFPGGDLEAALRALEEHEPRVDQDTKMEVRYHLWDLTKDKTHLTEAKRLLDFVVEHAPAEYRTSMIENVPLHRDIMRAWQEHGEKK